jgi:hypothetical protein
MQKTQPATCCPVDLASNANEFVSVSATKQSYLTERKMVTLLLADLF